jgi:hypothetical protein
VLLHNVSGSRVSDCLLHHADHPSDWKPLVVEGGSGNVISDNQTIRLDTEPVLQAK